LFESPLIVSAKNRPVRLLSWPISIVRCGAQKKPLIAACRPKLKLPVPFTFTRMSPQF
jgi:hypothetical protein